MQLAPKSLILVVGEFAGLAAIGARGCSKTMRFLYSPENAFVVWRRVRPLIKYNDLAEAHIDTTPRLTVPAMLIIRRVYPDMRPEDAGAMLINICSGTNVELARWVASEFLANDRTDEEAADLRVSLLESACAFGRVEMAQWVISALRVTAEEANGVLTIRNFRTMAQLYQITDPSFDTGIIGIFDNFDEGDDIDTIRCVVDALGPKNIHIIPERAKYEILRHAIEFRRDDIVRYLVKTLRFGPRARSDIIDELLEGNCPAEPFKCLVEWLMSTTADPYPHRPLCGDYLKVYLERFLDTLKTYVQSVFFSKVCMAGDLESAKWVAGYFRPATAMVRGGRALGLACELERADVVRWLFTRFELDQDDVRDWMYPAPGRVRAPRTVEGKRLLRWLETLP